MKFGITGARPIGMNILINLWRKLRILRT